MELAFIKSMWYYAAVLAAAVILLLSIVSGYRSGAASAQSVFASAQALEIEKALDFFYNDFDRYPTTEEFFDEKVMATYFSAFPLAEFPSSVCSQTFGYRQLQDTSYQIGVCLPVAVSGMQAGWNRITHNQ